MIDAMRYESTRIRTLRSTYWLIALGLLLTGGVALIITLAESDSAMDDELVVTVLTGGGSDLAWFLPIFMAIVGVFATGHEYRHGTIQPTLTTIPQRSTLLLAKIVTVLVTAAIVAVLSLAINLGIGMLSWDELPELGSAPLRDVIPGYVLLIMIYGVLGLALAQLFRGVPAALVVLLVVPFVVEPLIVGLSNIEALDWLEPVLKFLPFSAGHRLIVADPDASGGMDIDFLDRWASGGVFAGFTLLILAVAWGLFKSRDA